LQPGTSSKGSTWRNRFRQNGRFYRYNVPAEARTQDVKSVSGKWGIGDSQILLHRCPSDWAIEIGNRAGGCPVMERQRCGELVFGCFRYEHRTNKTAIDG